MPNGPTALATAPDGTLFVAENGSRRIRQITPSGRIDTFAGGWKDDCCDVRSLAVSGDALVVAERYGLRRLALEGGGRTWVWSRVPLDTATELKAEDLERIDVMAASAGELYLACFDPAKLWRVNVPERTVESVPITLFQPRFADSARGPTALALASGRLLLAQIWGPALYVIDTQVRPLTGPAEVKLTVNGIEPAWMHVTGIATSGDAVYFSDVCRVFRVDDRGRVEVVAGGVRGF